MATQPPTVFFAPGAAETLNPKLKKLIIDRIGSHLRQPLLVMLSSSEYQNALPVSVCLNDLAVEPHGIDVLYITIPTPDMMSNKTANKQKRKKPSKTKPTRIANRPLNLGSVSSYLCMYSSAILAKLRREDPVRAETPPSPDFLNRPQVFFAIRPHGE
jgi:hypothetical protein